MRTFHGSEKARGKIKKPVIALGVFDGVHRGHQYLLKQCKRRAQAIGGSAVVYTFYPHPVQVLSPSARPLLLMTQEQQIETLKNLKMDAVVIETFNKRFSRLSPDQFFQRILVERLHAKEIVVGYDFTFGVHRKGTSGDLKDMAIQQDIKVHAMEAFLLDEYLVSSSAIRQRLQDGDILVANHLLGRPYFIDGHIVRGDGMGSQLGFPTANLETTNELIPAPGVYATYARVMGRRYRSVTNIGTRPTFGGRDQRIETHLLHFKKSLLKKAMRLQFMKRLRPEIRFAQPEELVAQIHRDIKNAESFFKGASS